LNLWRGMVKQAIVNNRAQSAHRAQIKHTKANNNATLPPYGISVDKFKPEAGLIVCVGSKSWDHAKSKSWIAHMPKVVLPFSESPSCYKWPVHNRTVMICSFGQPESHQCLIELSKCLLKHGAIWVLWTIKGSPITKIERPSMEKAA